MVEGDSEEVYFKRIARLTESCSIRVKVSRDKRPADMVNNCLKEAERLGLDKDDPMIVVFDLDVVDDEELDEAVALAKSKGVRIMVSNLSFEIWLLMHLRDVSHLHTQDDYEDALSQLIGHRYRKSEGLKERLNQTTVGEAVRRGRSLLHVPDPKLCKNTPNTTTLWELLSEMLKEGA